MLERERLGGFSPKDMRKTWRAAAGAAALGGAGTDRGDASPLQGRQERRSTATSPSPRPGAAPAPCCANFLLLCAIKPWSRQILFAFSASLFTIFIYTCAAARWRAVNNKRTLCYAREQMKKVIWTAVLAVPLTLASFSWVSHPAAETSVAARTLLWPIEGASALANTPAQVAQANGSPASEEYPASAGRAA